MWRAAQPGDEFVHDARNGNVTGPYKAGEGEALRAQLCAFVYENGLGRLLGPASKIVGPFYVFDSPAARFGPRGELLDQDGRALTPMKLTSSRRVVA